ncbi:hypothetical protein AB0M22_45005 [Nocardia sp. NPDC051756]|uniref:hypothetical protein n=1 Tax=Nocardia sp. NPDC051756 TaxID=3154751 RepID=UPI003433EF0B
MRRRVRTGGIDRHVASRITREQIDALITELTATPELRDALLDLLEYDTVSGMIDDHAEYFLQHTLQTLQYAELRSLLTDDPDEQATHRRSCRSCGRQLEQLRRGRPREFCHSGCRQAAYRRRKGQRPGRRELGVPWLLASRVTEMAAEIRALLRTPDLGDQLKDAAGCSSDHE